MITQLSDHTQVFVERLALASSQGRYDAHSLRRDAVRAQSLRSGSR